MFNRAQSYLRSLLGPQADFRRDQWRTLEAIVEQQRRVLLVQRHGWGKNLVALLAVKLRRFAKAGPALWIASRRSRVREEIRQASRLGLQFANLYEKNRDEWPRVVHGLERDAFDLLLISPELLGHEPFRETIWPLIRARLGLVVIDDAHLLADESGGFRPDYRRIGKWLRDCPPDVPLLATTSAVNRQMVGEIGTVLGSAPLLIRGPLVRTTIRLQNLCIPDPAGRLAWLGRNLHLFPGSGLIACLTVADTERVAAGLNRQGLNVQAYHGGLKADERTALEMALRHNEVKALAATTALDSGFNKPDLGFVIHFQMPGSLATYYQQVGRAGRAIDKSYGILLAGEEDRSIHEHFIAHAFPPMDVATRLLRNLDKTGKQTFDELSASLKIPGDDLERVLKFLHVEEAIAVSTADAEPRYERTAWEWKPDYNRIQETIRRRRDELTQMGEYLDQRGCLMEFLARALDDPEAHPCGVCANCQGRGFKVEG